MYTHVASEIQDHTLCTELKTEFIYLDYLSFVSIMFFCMYKLCEGGEGIL